MKTFFLIFSTFILNYNFAISKDGILRLKPEEFITKPIKKIKKSKKKVYSIEITDEIKFLMDSIANLRYSNIPLKGYKPDSDGEQFIKFEKIYIQSKHNKIRKNIEYRKNKSKKISILKSTYLDFTIISEENIS